MRFFNTRPFVAALFALLVAFGGCKRSPPLALEVGGKAPPFEASSIDGKKLRFPEDTADKVVLVRFWAERCPHCEAEMKSLEELFSRLAPEGFSMLAVNAGQPQSTAAAFARRLGLSYAVLLDEDNSIAKRYGVSGVPTSFMVDKHGIVRAKFIGQTPAGEFEQSARALLGPPPALAPAGDADKNLEEK